MSLKIIVVPCLTDNYAYIIHDTNSNKTTLVDAPDFEPIKEQLEKQKWGLDNILITHHHEDHIAGISSLVTEYDPVVFGAEADKERLPKLHVTLTDRDKFSVSERIFKSIDVSGHTRGHLAFYCASEKILFSGDSLMALGCGRIFEGTSMQMYESLEELRKLPDETIIYSGHEYAEQNAKFALTVDSHNSDLVERMNKIVKNLDLGIPNTGVSLDEEKKTNPFLRTGNAEIRKNLGLENAPDVEVFTLLRTMKDNF